MLSICRLSRIPSKTILRIRSSSKNSPHFVLPFYRFHPNLILIHPDTDVPKLTFLPTTCSLRQYFVNPDDTVSQKVSFFFCEQWIEDFRVTFLGANLVHDWLQIVVHKTSARGTHFRRAGPRQRVYFQSDEVNAAIVTCGGLCPGLNTVVRELVCGLYDMYGVTSVVGIEVRSFRVAVLCKHFNSFACGSYNAPNKIFRCI